MKIVSRDWLTKVGHSIMSNRLNVHRQNVPPFLLDLPAVIVVFIDILPNWGLFGIIKQICHASVSILMECLPEGGWFSRGRSPRETYICVCVCVC